MDAVATITQEPDGKFEIPESCIGSAADARTTISTLVQAEGLRATRRAKINGMWNGNPPWPGLLKAKGQGERANFTLREFEGFVSAAKTPYYALAFKADRFAQFTIDYGNADPGQLAEWAGKIATRYQYALEDWDGLDMNMQHSQVQMVVHGIGPMMWEDEWDWRSDSRNAGQLLLPDDASADIDKWDTAGCRRSYLPSELWKKIRNESAATARKWNVPAVKRAIMNAGPENLKTGFGMNYEYYEAELRKGSMGYDAKSKRIFVADLFQKEFDGKISHFIVLQVDEPTTEDNSEKPADDDFGFLFRKIGRFDSYAQIVCPFLFDVGPDKQALSVKGAGPKIFDFCSASDRLTMRTLDGAMKAAGIIVQAKDGKSLQEAAFTDTSGGTIIGPGYDAQQQRIAPDLQSPLLAKRTLSMILSDNTGNYMQRLKESNPAPTLGQEQLTVQRESVLGDHDASRYCKYLDRFHRETFRRLLAMGKKLFASRKDVAPDKDEKSESLTTSEKGALKFYKSLVVNDGIPEEILEFENFCRIMATRLVGNGSSQMRTIIGEKMLGMIPMMNERGRTFTQRMVVSGLAGETVADATFPAYDTPDIVDQNVSVATMENNFLRMPGAKLRVSPDQDDIAHFGIHMQFVGEVGQGVQAGQVDPHELLVVLEQAGPHTYEHIQEVAGDPTRKQQVKGMMEAWMQMSKMTDQLAQQVAEMDAAAAAQQPQQAPDPDLIAALAKVNGDLAIKARAQEGKFLLQAQKQNFTMSQKDKEAAHSMRLKNFEAATDAARQPQEQAA
jgi:hypothetical protein